jgi:hypothetical protein
VDANEDDTACNTYEAVCAVVTNDAVDALFAHDAVPNNEPVIPFCTVNDPVITCEPLIVSTRDDCRSTSKAEPEYMLHRDPDNESFTVNSVPNEPLNVNTVEPELYALMDPVTPNEPVICADPVYGNGEIYPSKYDAVNAYDAVVARDADTAFKTYEAV